MKKKLILLIVSLFVFSCNNDNEKLKYELSQKNIELQQLKDKQEKQARDEKERQEREEKEHQREEKRKQDSIANAKKPENYCVGTWKQTLREYMGKTITDRAPDILTLFDDKTYKAKIIMADGYSAEFETGTWNIKNGNDVGLYLVKSQYATYLESMHYTLKGNKLLSKCWVYQNGEIVTGDYKEVFQKIEK